MRRQTSVITLLLLLLLAACTTTQPNRQESSQDTSLIVKVYKPPSWGCCGDWIAYMEAHGYTVQVENTPDLMAIKSHYQIPPALHSCHTAIVDGYIIEGHVSVAEISRLLAERPNITGLAVPGMPIGSPGMEVEGAPAQPYDVIAFDQAGNSAVFASYGN